MKKTLSIGLSVIIAGGLMWLVLSYVDVQGLQQTLSKVNWLWILPSCALFILFQSVRAARLRLTSAPEASIGDLIGTTAFHAVVNRALPMGLGAAAMVYLLHRRHGVSPHLGTTALVMTRVIDLLILISTMLATFALLQWHIPVALQYLLGFTVAALIGLAITLVIMLKMRQKNGRSGAVIDNFFLRHIHNFLDSAEHLLMNTNALLILITSLFLWGVFYLYYFTLTLALNLGLDPQNILILFVTVTTISLIPIKGIGNFGTHEALWFVALQLIGFEASRAAALGVVSHLLVILTICCAGLIPLFHWIKVYLSRKSVQST